VVEDTMVRLAADRIDSAFDAVDGDGLATRLKSSGSLGDDCQDLVYFYIEQRSHDLRDGLPDRPIGHRRYSQRPLTPYGPGDHDPLHRLGLTGAIEHGLASASSFHHHGYTHS
jgi:hypothetical protein